MKIFVSVLLIILSQAANAGEQLTIFGSAPDDAKVEWRLSYRSTNPLCDRTELSTEFPTRIIKRTPFRNLNKITQGDYTWSAKKSLGGFCAFKLDYISYEVIDTREIPGRPHQFRSNIGVVFSKQKNLIVASQNQMICRSELPTYFSISCTKLDLKKYESKLPDSIRIDISFLD